MVIPVNLKTLKRISLTPLLLLLLSCSPFSSKDGDFKTQVGYASWYGADFHGQPTASGETYDMHAMTAAHRTLPFGTVVRVVNLDNDAETRVTVNDRGPFVRGRIIDLSRAAAKKLGMAEAGVAKVRVEPLGRDTSYIRSVRVSEGGAGRYTVQLGSFAQEENATRLKKALGWKYSGVYMTKAEVSGKTRYRVRVGSFREMKKARRLAETLAEEGYEVVVMRE